MNASSTTKAEQQEFLQAFNASQVPESREEKYAAARHTQGQREAEEAKRPVRRMMAGFSALVPALLRSAVFSTAQTGKLRDHIKRAFPVARHDSIDDYKGGEVRYEGPELNQFHKRVLLGLIERAGASQDGSLAVALHAQEFLVAIGKDASSSGVAALHRILKDLKAATVEVANYAGDKGTVLGFVNDFDYKGRNYVVRLNHKLAEALKNHPTYIPMPTRKAVTDGLATALLDLLYATRQENYAIADLGKLWEREPHELGRELKVALEKLEAAGAIDSFSRSRGKVEIKRADLFAYRR